MTNRPRAWCNPYRQLLKKALLIFDGPIILLVGREPSVGGNSRHHCFPFPSPRPDNPTPCECDFRTTVVQSHGEVLSPLIEFAFR